MSKTLVALAVIVVSCGGTAEETASTTATTTTLHVTTTISDLPGDFPPAPDHPTGPLHPDAQAGLQALVDSAFTDSLDQQALESVVTSGDVRAAWLLADLLRFFQVGDPRDSLVAAFQDLTGLEDGPGREVDFVWAFDHLLAWDLPAWDGYPDLKERIYTAVEPGWEPFFSQDTGIEWRWITWGGVLADERPFGDNGPCNCIPALDDPATTDAAAGSWYPEDGVVFGVVVDGEALALPKNQMEVHEMVNLTLGGRNLGIPYCTLCGSAQAYLTDGVSGVDRVILRTSGLLSRSNKLMYDLATRSAVDTFTGRALSGPLGENEIVLEQVSVVASTWGDWKQAHPGTRILAEDGGIGRTYPEDPLGGRDDAGPIFPVGDVDPRLPVQEEVVGVIAPDGTPVAFPVTATWEALEEGGPITFEGLTVRAIDGIRVFDSSGEELVTHQSFWFAWSQFHPGTVVWPSFEPAG